MAAVARVQSPYRLVVQHALAHVLLGRQLILVTLREGSDDGEGGDPRIANASFSWVFPSWRVLISLEGAGKGRAALRIREGMLESVRVGLGWVGLRRGR